MVHNNKILTVSYGTFSCTLEGFDDSFGTMKAIAEYFRDLAADDRYFGAEPAVPDADMLARIAQREISRKVEARKEDGGGFVLTAEEAQDAPAALPDAAEATASEGIAVADQEAPAEPRPVTAPEMAAPAVQPEDMIAEDLVARETPAAPEPVVPAAPAVDLQPAPAPVQTPAPVQAPVLTPAPVQTPSLADAMAHETASAVPVFQAEPVAPVAAEPDSIAAKLQRIRAVVSRNETTALSAGDAEDEYGDNFVAQIASEMTEALNEDDETYLAKQDHGTDDIVTDALRRLDAAFEPEAGEIETIPAIDETDQEPAQPDILADQDFEDDDTDDVLMQSIMANTLETEPQTDTLSAEMAEPDADADDVDAEMDHAEPEEAETTVAPYVLSGSDRAADLTETSEDDPALAESPAGRPHVVKVNRAEFEAALAAGDLEEVAEDTNAESAEDFFGEADLDFDDLAEDEDQGEEDLSRLMAAADEKMDEPETATSRETYSQLRAAVAAAEAERSVGGHDGDEAGDDVYRDDLASVVRPRRPVSGGHGQERPVTESRPAPLKLVAEQRVDTDGAADRRGPVRPRRVAASLEDEAPAADVADESFAEFAAEMGATELPDLLEAAAAYMSFVEGRPQFSRPQLMNKVRQIEPEAYNREDGLRSFGRLLREGKIEKTGGGRFTASGDIGFRPDERAAG